MKAPTTKVPKNSKGKGDDTLKVKTQKNSSETRPGFAFITLDKLVLNSYNARRFEQNMTPQRQAKFDELTASIKEKGILEPLLVRVMKGGRCEVVAGERRFRAASRAVKENGMRPDEYEAPCMVRDISEDEAIDLMLIENLQRDDLTPLETATAFQTYLERHSSKGDAMNELSARTGIPSWTIRRQLRMLVLPEEVLTGWNEGKITQWHAEQLSRVEGQDKVMELYSMCLRLKLTGKELAEKIGTMTPELDKGFFDKSDCQVCQFNSSIQSGLFADVPTGRCGNAACYEAKQGEFFTANWQESKTAKMFGTRGFRFGHRLGQDRAEPIVRNDPAERCLECGQFVTVVRLNGVVVSGYARCCTGPRPCFEELYCQPPAREEEEQETTATKPTTTTAEEERTAEDGEKNTPAPESVQDKAPTTARSNAKTVAEQKPGDKDGKTPPAPPESEPVYSAPRGEKHREAFYGETLPPMMQSREDMQSLRFHLLSLALSAPAAKQHLIAALKLSVGINSEQLAKKIFHDIPVEELLALLRGASVAKIMDPTVPAAVRRIVAESCGLKIEEEWQITRDYLVDLNKSEIVRVCEEPGVNLWKNPQVEAYRKQHHKGKALLSLKKEELIDIILKSGAELKGRVPAEVQGTRQRSAR